MIQSVDDLYVINRARKKEMHQIYRTLYIDVMKKIDSKNLKSVYNLLYKPPTVIMGHVNYNHKTCMFYLVKKLSESGFIVFPIDNQLYIDWSFTKNTKVRKKVRFNI